MRGIALLGAWIMIGAVSAAMPNDYEAAFRAAQEAKTRGDWAAMEAALTKALSLGPGTEYMWRSLSWAQMHQGKWRLALDNARENVRRNGSTTWSLQQLYAAGMAAGDLEIARKALADEANLPESKRDREPLEAERKAFRAATVATVYDLTWTINVADYEVQKDEIIINIPFREHLWQKSSITIEGAEGSRIEKIGHKDVAFIKPGSASTVTIRARVVHKPEVRGPSFADRTGPIQITPELRLALGPFRNNLDYDPADPELAAVVAPLRRGTPGQRVQAVLDWLAANVKYEAGYPDDLASILKNRKGVCHHQSNLMVAMCRALGVPALVAHGVRLGAGETEFKDAVGSHGWVEVYLNGKWVGVEPLNPNSLRYFDSGYLIVDATGRGGGPGDDHFRMYTPDGRHIQGLQGVPVSGKSWFAE